MTYADGSTPKICIVGAGFSGLTAAIKLKKDLGLETFTLFDENNDVGGTWLVNTYPGCACDVQSHLYSWSFELNPNWSKNFSPQAEIWEYIRNTALKYDLYKHIHFNSKVKSLVWDEQISQWRVTVINKETKGEKEELFDVVINGPGALRVPSYPKEFEDFKGQKVHTAEWDSSISLENKVVGVVGSGASAVQVIIDSAPKVKELHCYQRKPAWISPRPQYEFSSTMKWIFNIFPPIMWLYRWLIFFFAEIRHGFFMQDSWGSKFATWALVRNLKKQIPAENPKQEQLIPKYTLGCKRIIKSENYYPTLALSHVKVYTEKIKEIREDRIGLEDGTSQKLDVLILATGFKVQDFFDPMQIKGKDDIDVMQAWKKEGPQTYFGICTSIAPNMFILLGPNTGLGHNSIIFMIECQVDFAIQIIREMMERGSRSVAVKQSTEEEFMEEVEEQLNKTVWKQGNCDSWYANAQGKITTLWPWNCRTYWKRTKVVDFSKFDFK